MKKLLFLLIAFSMMQVSAQTLSSASKNATTSNGTMIERLATDQVKSLTKKLDLNKTQQEQVSGLVVNQLKSEQFQKLLSDLSVDKVTGSGVSEKSHEQIQNALLLDKEFVKGMGSILDEDQMKTMEGYTPK